MARLYSVFANGGKEIGIEENVLNQLTKTADDVFYKTNDEVMKVLMAFQLGFMKPTDSLSFANNRSFGFMGLGGSFGFADPEENIGYAYAMNKLRNYYTNIWEEILRKTVYQCIEQIKDRENNNNQ